MVSMEIALMAAHLYVDTEKHFTLCIFALHLLSLQTTVQRGI